VKTQEEFEEYLDQFNESDDKSDFFDRYFDSDAVFIHPYQGRFQGKEELVRFWNSGKNAGHEGIKEILHLRNFISAEGKVAVELDIEWRCFKDTDYLGPRKKGEVFRGKCADFYRLKGDKISHVQLYVNLEEEL